MEEQPRALKISAAHNERIAFIYIRQSTLAQVREHTGSTLRQYDLYTRATELGWPPDRITLIDQDQGLSGSTSIGREGFQWLVAEVGLGHAGAVFCLEASRLARSCSDWYRLLELCALTATLVIDADGVYDPRHYNDRLLLGFKGTMSEAELHWLQQRMAGGKLAKAQKGQLHNRLPIGLVYDLVDHVVLDPDQEIQNAVRLVFDLFAFYASALAVVRHFADHHIQFPTRLWSGQQAGAVTWGLLTHHRVRDLLHNPFYAGAYVYGRSETITRALPDGHITKSRTRLTTHLAD